jgi:benzoyl-CoA reductase/2-hydroxyglutaryl-CoA dehydratase subunit BcrC/BadD/HgdB
MTEDGKMGDAEKAEKERRRIKSTEAMRELMTRYYIEAKTAGEKGVKVAWITSGGPVEPLYCFDVIPVYPENHGAMCGAAHMAVELAEKAEEKGFSRDICSYARCDFGSAYTQGGPIGGLPRPDFLVCCNNICNTVVKWYEELARYFEVPLFIFDTPFVRGELSEHAARYELEQMREYFAFLERATGREFDEGRFLEVAAKSLEAIGLWKEILSCAENVPSPMTCFDAFILMAPVVTLRGTDEVITFYRGLLEEMRQRVEEGIAIIPGERHRLLWDNIPIWYEMRNLGRLFMEERTCLVADTYTNAWTFDRVDVSRPMESLAEAYASIYLNIGLEQMLEQVVELAERFKVDGMIMHSNRSCKPYSLGQYDIARMFTRRTGLPALVIEADHTDSRVYDRADVETRIRHFLELL